MDDQWDSCCEFVVIRFCPKALLTQMVSVVAPHEDDGILREINGAQLVQHLTDQCIDVTDARVVAVSQVGNFLSAQVAILGNVLIAFEFIPAPGGQFGRVLRVLRVGGQPEFFRRVKVPVLFRGTKWQVRFPETYGQKERV